MPVLWIEIKLNGEGATGSDVLDLRHAVEKRIEAAGAGTVIGGGVALDGSSCDLEIECADVFETERFVQNVMNQAALGHTVSFRQSRGG